MSLPLFNISRGSASNRQFIAQLVSRVDDETVDGVINQLRQIDSDAAVLESLANWTAPLFELLQEVPPDDRAATCLTAVSLLE